MTVLSGLHELLASKCPFVSRIEFARSKLSYFSAHVSAVCLLSAAGPGARLAHHRRLSAQPGQSGRLSAGLHRHPGRAEGSLSGRLPTGADGREGRHTPQPLLLPVRRRTDSACRYVAAASAKSRAVQCRCMLGNASTGFANHSVGMYFESSEDSYAVFRRTIKC